MNATKNGSIPINGYVVVLIDGCNKVIVMFLSNAFDSSVIYDKVEGNKASDMVENPRIAACGYVYICGYCFDEFDVGKMNSLGNSVHSSLDINNDTLVYNVWSDIVFFCDIIWNGPYWYPHLFKIKHGRDKIEVGNIEAE